EAAADGLREARRPSRIAVRGGETARHPEIVRLRILSHIVANEVETPRILMTLIGQHRQIDAADRCRASGSVRSEELLELLLGVLHPSEERHQEAPWCG